MLKDFAVFILSHGRPDRITTYKLLKRSGYTGLIYIIIDNEDKKAERYYQNYGKQVIMFNKEEIEKEIDTADNFGNRQTILHARCACFDIAKQLGIKYFIQLDDDYIQFAYRRDNNFDYKWKLIRNLDKIFDILLEYYKTIPALSIALAQGGDFLGGENSYYAKIGKVKRKCMNSFICSVDRRFNFHGTMNEDVNTYCLLGSQGNLFLTIPSLSLTQQSSQQNKSGIVETYLKYGTYVKSFYTVIHNPSSVFISILNSKYIRIHHSVKWDNTVPMIIEEKYKKTKNKEV